MTSTNDLNTFGELLYAFRKHHHLSQQELADRMGLHRNTIGLWERGNYLPESRTMVVELAKQLHLSAPEARQLLEASLTSVSSYWYVPYQRNPHFTGRDDLLDQLTQLLSLENASTTSTTRRAILSQPQAIKGLGGIGKTQIAVEYAYRAREQGLYTHILWINAASEEAIITSFQMLADQLPGFPAKGEKDQRKLIATILRWLQACQEPWLLIFDNADELTLAQQYLPQQGQGSILLTTRANAVSWLTNSFEVEKMGLMEGTQFLLHRTQRLQASDDECNEASNIVIALDGFPLALDQAGAYIEETGCSFADYLHFYEQHRTSLLARRGKQASNYPASVATTWDISFQKIEQAHPAAAELLRLCAFLSADHIPEELLTDSAAHWPPLLQEMVADRFTFNQLLEALLAFSLVKRLAQERLLSLHRLIQTVQLDRMDSQEQRDWAQRVVYAVNALFPADPKEQVDSWPQCLRYLEQVQACDQLIQQHHLQLPEAADLLDRAGIYLREHASYGLAEVLFQRSATIVEQHLGPEHLQLASPLANLGILYKQQGKYEVAEPLYQRALQIREQTQGSEHLQVVSLLANLGTLYLEQGKYELAEPLLRRALQIREQTQGSEHLQVASLLTNLSALYGKQGKYELAEPLLQRALQIREQALGSEHLQVASILTNLGTLYSEQGKYELAEPLSQRALHIWEKVLGSHHPHLAYPLNNLGTLYLEQGKYELAEPLLRRALLIWEQVQGPHYPHLAYPLNSLGNIYRQQNQYEQANAFYQRALTLRQEHLGSQHPDVAETLHDLAQLRQIQQQSAEALALYQQALAIWEQAFGAQHPKTIETREHLYALQRAQGKADQNRLR